MSRKVAEVLRAAKSRIDTLDKWCQHQLFNFNGSKCCSLGALALENGKTKGDFRYRMSELCGFVELAQVMPASNVDTNPVHEYNDSHNHGEVMAAWDRAIALAEQTGAECGEVQS